MSDSAQDERNRQGSSRDFHRGGGQQPSRGYKDVTDQVTDELGTLRPNNPPQGGYYDGGQGGGQYGGSQQYGQNQYGGGQQHYGGGQQQYGGGQQGGDMLSGLIGGFLGGGGSNQPQGPYSPPQGQYGGGQYGPGPHGPPQGQYGGDQYGPGPYGPPPGQYGGGYGPPQGQYGPGGEGGYGPPPNQQQGGSAGMAGMAANFIGGIMGGGGGGGSNQGQGQQRNDGMNELISGMAANYIGGMISGNKGSQGDSYGGGDYISNMASSVIGNLFSGDSGQSATERTGLNSGMVSGIVSNIVRNVRGRPQAPDVQAASVNDDMVAAVTSAVIKEIVSQDTEGKILPSRDANANSPIVTSIATKVVQNIMSGRHRGGGGGGSGGIGNDLISGMASQYIGNLISGGGGGQGHRTQRNEDDVLSGIASNVIGGLVGGGGGGGSQPTQAGGAIASNIIGKIVSGGGGGGRVSDDLISQIDVHGPGPVPTRPSLPNGPSGIPGGFPALPRIPGGLPGQPGGQVGSGTSMYRAIAATAVEAAIGNKLGEGVVNDVVKATSTDVLAEVMEGAVGAQFSKKEDGEIVENLTQSHVDPSKHRIFPDPGSMWRMQPSLDFHSSTLISSFMSKGAYHLRNRLFRGGRGKEARISPAHAVFRFGERGSGLRPRGQVQDFYSLRQQCMDEGTLFEDPEFPAEDSSIFFSRSPPKPFEWKRPPEIMALKEITDDPQLFIDGASRFDVKQGELGDCWLLAAVANLTLNRRLFYQIVPSDQSFGDNYAGIFHFRFWQYGRWVDVVIDDRLPTFYGRLVFMHSEEKNEFWSALVEKAYAKLHGSYEALKGGTTCEAMEDFTGGVSEIYDLTKAPPNLFNIMLKAYQRGSLMGCSIEPDPNVVEARCDTGLVRGHAYSVTRIKYCEINTPRVSGKIPLIRIRNPWGNEAEWVGAWSDQSPEWQFIPPEEKAEMGLTFEHDGEFWMSFKDFMTNFTMLELTNLNPDSMEDEDITGSVQHKWEMSVFEGAWIRGSTAGGCRNNLQTFWHNPQYRIMLTEVDDDDEDNKCTVIVALMQKNRRSQRKLGLECLTIGFAIYHLRDPDDLPRPLDLNFFKYHASVARSPSFINMREVSCRFKLPPGTYCIVPSTFDHSEEGEFILRVFSEKATEMEENDEDVGFGEVDDRDEHRARGKFRSSFVRKVQPGQDDTQEAEADERVRGFFRKVAGDDLEIDWKELQDVLNFALKREFNFEGFSKDICRSMIAMMDVDRSGKLGLQEFLQLWTDIRVWKNSFRLYDKDNSGHLCSFELRQALNSAGYRLNNHICNALMLRYGDQEGRISFDDFIMCSVKLKTMMGFEDDPEKQQEFYDELMTEQENRGEEQQEEDEE
ncbi:uncharacterized protein [Panulirus ornatus]|uniref:uncharacterized protein isoform X21 n=1 Tax=Panulirus ornatus TaxID=150431 RepID=UPI003A881ED5